MTIQLEALERKVGLLDRKIAQLVDASRNREQIDFFVNNGLGTDDIALAANALYLYPLFPPASIGASAVFLSARRNPGSPGTSTVRLALYRANVAEHFINPTQDEVTWGESASAIDNRTQWRKVFESPLLTSSDTLAYRMKWTFPQEISIGPGPNLWAFGILTDTADCYFQGTAAYIFYAPIRVNDASSPASLPPIVTSTHKTSSNAISLTFLSKRAMKVMGR